jgi:hypothetical protein
MSIIYSQNFDSLSNGDLNGQDSWSGSGIFDVESSVVYAGARAVGYPNNGNGLNIVRAFTPQTDLTKVSIYVRGSAASNINATIQFFDSSSGFLFAMYMRENNYFQIYNGTFYSISTWSPDTWYFIEFEVDVPNNQARMRVDGGSWSSWYAFATSDTDFGMIALASPGLFGGISYVDELTIYNDIVLCIISGVVSLSGTPVAGAIVRCIRQSDNVAIAQQTTDSTGEYLFEGLDITELYHLAVEYESGDIKYNALSLWDVSPFEI